MTQVLLCGHCGGPLPKPQANERYLTCRFCEATSDLQTRTHEWKTSARVGTPRERFPAELLAFELRLSETAGAPALDSFRAAAHATLSSIADPEALTNVTFGIVADFHTKTGVDISNEPVALGRIAIAYLDSLERLSTASATTINLPFLTATPQGPLHFTQDVTMERLHQLAAKDAASVVPKRGWLSKLFG